MGLVLLSPFQIDNDHSLLSPPHCKCAGVGDMELEPLKEDNILCQRRILPPSHSSEDAPFKSFPMQSNKYHKSSSANLFYWTNTGCVDDMKTVFTVFTSVSNRVIHANIRQNFWSINYKYMKVG